MKKVSFFLFSKCLKNGWNYFNKKKKKKHDVSVNNKVLYSEHGKIYILRDINYFVKKSISDCILCYQILCMLNSKAKFIFYNEIKNWLDFGWNRTKDSEVGLKIWIVVRFWPNFVQLAHKSQGTINTKISFLKRLGRGQVKVKL